MLSIERGWTNPFGDDEKGGERITQARISFVASIQMLAEVLKPHYCCSHYRVNPSFSENRFMSTYLLCGRHYCEEYRKLLKQRSTAFLRDLKRKFLPKIKDYFRENWSSSLILGFLNFLVKVINVKQAFSWERIEAIVRSQLKTEKGKRLRDYWVRVRKVHSEHPRLTYA